MSPGLVGSEVAATIPQYHTSNMEESLFPAINRRSVVPLDSEADPNEFCNKGDHHSRTRASIPNSLSSSPIKFPSIDRANSTSIASLPGSRANRHRSQTRDFRNNYNRSPSCPSNLDISRDFSNVDFAVITRDRNNSPSIDSSNESTKLPSIFSGDFKSDKSKQSKRRDISKETRAAANALSLRRTESLVNAVRSSPEDGAYTNKDTSQRQSQTAALLLPLRTENQLTSHKKKKKRRSRGTQDASVREDVNQTPRNADSEHVLRRRATRKTEEALDVIARENDFTEDDEYETPRAIELNSSRKVERWMKTNTQKEGEVKV